MAITQEHKNILIAHSDERTASDWVEYFDGKYNAQQIQRFCKSVGCTLGKVSRRKKSPDEIISRPSVVYNANQRWRVKYNYFAKWSANMAYVLGFWFANGCIYRSRMFDITVPVTDKSILEKIAEELKYPCELYDEVDRQFARINFSCEAIFRDIVALVGKECKSTEIKFPQVPEEYLPDFIRGYFDGNGSVMISKNNKLGCAFTSGSKQFLTELLKILHSKAYAFGGTYDAATCSLIFTGEDSKNIGIYMYKNNPQLFLLRKQKKFEIFIKEEIQP